MFCCRKILLTVSILIGIVFYALSQESYRLGLEYYNKKEFEKSATHFEQLLNKTPNETFLRYYLMSLVELKKYTEADKAIRTYSKKFGKSPTYNIETGHIYKMMNKIREAEKLYREALGKAIGNRSQTISVANRFISFREFEWAERTYLEASKKQKDQTSFQAELANVYYYMHNHAEMVDIYLELLAQSDGFLQMVQNRLNTAIYTDTDKSLITIVEQQLLQKIQQYPTHDVFSELLIWTYMQQNNYAMAYIQAKALDLRNNEDGGRLLSLGQAANAAEDFETALNSYTSITQKGQNSPYFFYALIEMLNVSYIKIKLGIDFTPDKINKVCAEHAQTLNQYGYTSETLEAALNYAQLLAFYAHTPEDALNVLEKASTIPRISNINKAKISLLRGDILFAQDKIWDATLVYAKVERDNSEHPIGSLAKYRKVEMAFFKHDFDWAKTQIDVLKASTGKLISNEAIEMSIQIYEGASDDDSTHKPLRFYASALMKCRQNKNKEALLYIDSLTVSGQSFLAVEGLLLKAKINILKNNYKEAVNCYDIIIRQYSYETNIDKALFQNAVLQLDYLNNKPKAIELLTQMLKTYPASIYCIEARKLISKVRTEKPSV